MPKPILILVIVFAMLNVRFQCNKDVYVPDQYNLVELLNLYPAKQVYKPGDTIYLQLSNSDNKFFDSKSGKSIGVDTMAFYFGIGFTQRYSSVVSPPDGFCDFHIDNSINVIPDTSALQTNHNFWLKCGSGNNHNFLIRIIPKYKGIFSIDLQNSNGSLFQCNSTPNPLPHSTFEYKFNNLDGNKSLFQSIPIQNRGEFYGGSTETAIDNGFMFVFRVE